VAGGGPAGMMTGFLLARAGVDVVVLEKHADFNRDFRGDTIHPSTFELMHELGFLEEFLKQPHQETRELRGVVNGTEVTIADFSHLPVRCKFLGLMPQWDFLNFLSGQAKRLSSFHLHMETEVIELILESNRVAGVRARTPRGELEVRADLVIGADGRHSTVRNAAGFEPKEYGVPIDVLWMRLSRRPNDADRTGGYFQNGKMMVALNRDDYWQCALVIPKGGFDAIKARGLPAFHDEIGTMAPFLRERARELADWSQVRLLTVQINRLPKWARTGLLCLGDAAHAMSPAGGVGINLAIQDAVAAANLLAAKLRRGPVGVEELDAVQRRREWPTRLIQKMQMIIHKRVDGRSRQSGHGLPLALWLLKTFPILRRLPARFIGLGPRPEHVQTPLAA
jgi:2-polyprenyl-6-methoxyphenol hydroxylase-like FAD-dependent oxidoreductase